MEVVEASIADLRHALTAGETSSVALVTAYLDRIARFDRSGPCLNSVPVLNPAALDEARASDDRRKAGQTLGPLDGIPYTAKDSYKVRGLTVSAGSPAFATLIATDDAFAIAQLRRAGAVLIGLTNMPPMANGGMQRGLYGRAESPYNADYLTAAFASGSSNGSGTATAASFATFGLGEETWSSGRAPAANNALCAYTPSRGVISVRGNWPLVPTMDVVVPHTRSMADMFEVLDIIVADDPDTRGDLWRSQPWISLPAAPPSGPPHMRALAGASLRGKRFGVPAMYINADAEAGAAPAPGIGGPTGQRIDTRASIMELWRQAREVLTQAGAEVVTVDFPTVSNYEGDRPGCPTIGTRGLIPEGYLKREIVDLSVWAWDDFLRANADPALSRLADVDGARIFPVPPGSLPDRYTGFEDDIADYPAHAPCPSRWQLRGDPDPARRAARAGGDAQDRPRGLDGPSGPRCGGVPGGGRCWTGGCGHQSCLRRSGLAQRGLGGERQSRDPSPRHPDRDRAHGDHVGYRDACGPHLCRPRLCGFGPALARRGLRGDRQLPRRTTKDPKPPASKVT